MFKRILVSLDGSARAERALPVAARIARASNGSIILLRVLTSSIDFAWYAMESAIPMQENMDTVQCVFWGLGSDGTVGANKNSIKIIGEGTANYAQGYFVYDSKKSGSVTISHLRFGPGAIHAPYLIGTGQANVVACHQFSFLERIDVLKYASPGGVFLLDSIYGPQEVWEHLPSEVQQAMIDKKLRFYVINAQKVANETGMGRRINTVMQTCFFAISGVLPTEQAIAQIKHSIQKTYSKRGEAVVQQNFFEFSGACSGCGETPYIKLATQLFGDRMVVANATGCSSIYGGNLPTTPWTINAEGRGPAWSNSLFEDNAEFGLGMRVTLDKQQEYACELLARCSGTVGEELVAAVLDADQSTEAGLKAQRERIALIKQRLENQENSESPRVQALLSVVDVLVRRSVWIIGGDGWAYDIGFGGLDHVLASGRNVNVLVLDSEVYSNTGGQASKSTPRAAVAKFAARGKATSKKDLGMLAMAYGKVYVAQVAMGANDQQTLRAFLEAEAYDGPSLILAYSHCIAHGIDMRRGLDQQKLAVQTGYWPLYRYNPALLDAGKNPLILDCKEPTLPLEEFAYNETRYRMLLKSNEERAETLMDLAKKDVQERWQHYRQLAAVASHTSEK